MLSSSLKAYGIIYNEDDIRDAVLQCYSVRPLDALCIVVHTDMWRVEWPIRLAIPSSLLCHPYNDVVKGLLILGVKLKILNRHIAPHVSLIPST